MLSLPARHPHPLEGVWKITYPWHIEVENGVVKPVMETGELTVPFGTGEAVFIMRDQVSFHMGGSERQATAVSTWRFSVDGDQLRGSLERRVEGISEGHGPLAITGSRVGPNSLR